VIAVLVAHWRRDTRHFLCVLSPGRGGEWFTAGHLRLPLPALRLLLAESLRLLLPGHLRRLIRDRTHLSVFHRSNRLVAGGMNLLFTGLFL